MKSYLVPKKPWEAGVVYILKLPVTMECHQYLLVAIDHLSGFSILVPIIKCKNSN